MIHLNLSTSVTAVLLMSGYTHTIFDEKGMVGSEYGCLLSHMYNFHTFCVIKRWLSLYLKGFILALVERIIDCLSEDSRFLQLMYCFFYARYMLGLLPKHSEDKTFWTLPAQHWFWSIWLNGMFDGSIVKIIMSTDSYSITANGSRGTVTKGSWYLVVKHGPLLTGGRWTANLEEHTWTPLKTIQLWTISTCWLLQFSLNCHKRP